MQVLYAFLPSFGRVGLHLSLLCRTVCIIVCVYVCNRFRLSNAWISVARQSHTDRTGQGHI